MSQPEKTSDPVFEKVCEALQAALGIDAAEIAPNSVLKDDLSAESIDLLDIAFRLEKIFSLPKNAARDLENVLLPEPYIQAVLHSRGTDAPNDDELSPVDKVLMMNVGHLVDWVRFKLDQMANAE